MRMTSSTLAKVRENIVKDGFISILHLLLVFDNVNGDENCIGVGKREHGKRLNFFAFFRCCDDESLLLLQILSLNIHEGMMKMRRSAVVKVRHQDTMKITIILFFLVLLAAMVSQNHTRSPFIMMIIVEYELLLML